ncbi:MAG: DNA helicase RecQ [Gammaproteobacteria bacterium]|nr:MAG: DNA helicase RecQ [Gammaproteobacteria bacterium]
MEDAALHYLQNTFGYSEFRLQQSEIVNTLINSDDAVVLMPTGGGKSLCYQIPSLVRDGTGIIISPLIALMQDQVSALQQLGINAAYLNSTLDARTSRQTEDDLINGRLDMLYVAPERLTTNSFLHLLKRTHISLFAIDEAHCVSQWGHDFRPDYIQLSLLHEQFPDVPRIALTATADENTRTEIKHRLQLDDAREFISSFDRPNICYRISEAQSNARAALLRFIQNEHQNDAGIVYCLSRKKVETIAAWLTEKGFTALPYHAGLPASIRETNQHRFLNEDAVIIVATIAFGMGIDKPDVRFVAHLNLPKSMEAYYQETGRAGRDGLPANAWMAYGLKDVITLKQMMANSTAEEQYKRVEHHKLETMLGFTEITSCRRQSLLSYFDETLDKPCGNCDNCITPAETWDATVAAQKALSCVHRTGQRFGVNYLIEILTGKEDDRSKQFGHDKLSVFGIGKEFDVKQWRSIFRQLISRNLLAVDFEGHGSLQLTEQCRAVLRGEHTLLLRKESKRAKASRKGRKSYRSDNTANNLLWEALRHCRKTLAEENNVPPFVIFHDATLMEMMERQPETHQQFLQLSGVGESKLEKYADAFLKTISEHSNNTIETVSDTISESLLLFRSGMNATSIAAQRNIKETTVYSHLASCIEQGEIKLNDVIDLAEQEINIIHETLLSINDDDRKLKPVYDALDGLYDYNTLRCVQAAVLPG